MSTAAGVAAGAAAISASNSAQLARIKREKCELIIETYNPNVANVVEMKQYAECVKYIHPDPISNDAVLAGKIFVSILLMALLIGLIAGIFRPRSYEDLVDRVILRPLCYLGITFVTLVAAVLILGGIVFVLG